MSIAGFEGLKLPDSSIRAGLVTLAAHDTLVDEDPCSGRAFVEIPIASASDVDAIVEASWKAFREPAWRDLAPLQRERLLHRFADAIEADLPRLAALEALDTGKPVSQAAAIDMRVGRAN
jgi:aldehyde dehydrogenase (NAD+)/phenylacetaldehyde dehydrogenase